MKRLLVLFSILSFFGCAQIGYLKDPFTDIPEFSRVDSRLWRGGLPDERGFSRLRELGIKTVISLRGDDEKTAEEKKLIESMNMNFFHLPMSVYERPPDELVMRFIEIVLTGNNQPVFVHCQSGRDRTGAMIAVYRILVYDWTIKDAYREAKAHGFFPYRGDAHLHKLIHQIKDKPSWFQKTRELLNNEKK